MNSHALGTSTADCSTEQTQVKSAILIRAPRDRVWAILADLGGIQEFHPQVKQSYWNSERRDGVGAARVCEFGGGRRVTETAVEWEPGESFVLRLHDGKGVPPFSRAFARLDVSDEEGGTRVTMRLEYSLRFGPLGRLMDRMMVRAQFEKVVPSVLGGLKEFAERP